LATGLEGVGKTLVVDLGAGADPGAEANRILVNLTMVVSEAWPRARRIGIEISGGAILISAEGGGDLGETWRAALSGGIVDLDPRTAQAYLAGRLARAAGALIDLPPGRLGAIRLVPPPIPGG
ncbi:MAG: hypothetical protein K9H11_11190, partial [Rhodospirillum sp.]|nr:hypothetical protein [Rhodospirillum sp.]